MLGPTELVLLALLLILGGFAVAGAVILMPRRRPVPPSYRQPTHVRRIPPTRSTSGDSGYTPFVDSGSYGGDSGGCDGGGGGGGGD